MSVAWGIRDVTNKSEKNAVTTRNMFRGFEFTWNRYGSATNAFNGEPRPNGWDDKISTKSRALAEGMKSMKSTSSALDQLVGARNKFKKYKQSTKNDRSVEVVTDLVRVIESWPDKTLGNWRDAAAGVAWRERISLRFEASDRSDRPILRVMVRYLTGCSAKRASSLAIVVQLALKSKLRSNEVADWMCERGGFDTLAYNRSVEG